MKIFLNETQSSLPAAFPLVGHRLKLLVVNKNNQKCDTHTD